RYGIPNYVIQKLYYDYFRAEAEQRAQCTLSNRSIEDAVMELALRNNIIPLTEEINKVLTLFSNRDFMNMDEKHIKAVILTLLYQSEVYFIRSEPEINNRYPDIMLLERNPFKVEHQFLFELKFSKKKDGAQGRNEKKEQGIRQIQEYLCLEDIRCLPKLRSYLLLTDGSEMDIIAVG
ncbi:MAG: AAA family ATPase, partial [Candidatus Electrothrix sp. AR3]|nr:AAA family ATPase [Candidatus Electrothrix sp. AR3]